MHAVGTTWYCTTIPQPCMLWVPVHIQRHPVNAIRSGMVMSVIDRPQTSATLASRGAVALTEFIRLSIASLAEQDVCTNAYAYSRTHARKHAGEHAYMRRQADTHTQTHRRMVG